MVESPTRPWSSLSCFKATPSIQVSMIIGFLCSLATDGCSWRENLLKSVVVYNNTLHAKINMYPSQFLLTRTHKTSNSFPLENRLPEAWRLGHPKFVPFQPGQLVLVKLQHKGFLNINKLLPTFSGPFRVTKLNSNNITYELTDELSGETHRVHHAQVRLYKEPPDYLLSNPYFIEKNVHLTDMTLESNCFVDALLTTSTGDDSGSYTSCDVYLLVQEFLMVVVQCMLISQVTGTLNVIFLDFPRQMSLDY